MKSSRSLMHERLADRSIGIDQVDVFSGGHLVRLGDLMHRTGRAATGVLAASGGITGANITPFEDALLPLCQRWSRASPTVRSLRSSQM